MRHGSIFSGIGGFDLAAAWAGWDNLFSCEKDPFCRKVLNFHWPQTQQHEDIYQFDATGYRGSVDIISGGFPCQPFSSAGRRKGKADDRYLWPQARRIITEARPEWVVLENVAGLFTILEPESLSEMEIKAVELFCSDGEQKANPTIVRLQRRVIGSIISEIGSAGYVLPQMEDGTPVVLCIPACAINAPHRRDRIWFVAHAGDHADRAYPDRPGNLAGNGTDGQERETETTQHQGRPDADRRQERADPNHYGDGQHTGNRPDEIITGQGGQYAQHDIKPADRADTAAGRFAYHIKPDWFSQVPGWDEWPAQPPVCGRDDGLPRHLDGITFPKWRSESIRGYGNAIVPQIAYEIFRSIAAQSAGF